MQKLIRKIIGFSLKNRYFTVIASILLAVIGVITFHNMSIEAFPDVTNTEISIITQWPGRSAEEIEKFVTIPVEIAMNPVQKKISLRSTSIFGLSMVKLIFDDDVPDAYARAQVTNMLQNLTLPDAISPQVQPPTGPTGEIYRYTLESPFRDVTTLKTLQDWTIDRELRAVPGVADIVSFGGRVKTYEIRANPMKLANLGISALDISNAVGKTNINIGGDVVVDNNQAYVVRGIGLLNNINEINNIIVENVNGIPVLIKDVADVEISSQPRLGAVGRSGEVIVDGKRQIKDNDDVVEGIVLMRKGENPGEVIKNLKAKIQHINKEILPADVKIRPYYNREDLIDYATETVLHNLMEGILLVTFLVSAFMFNWRTTLIVSIVIPLALLFSFICLHLMGMSANLLSLGAVDFGIIIDGAVVMVEGLFVALDHKAETSGMDRFNKLAKLGLIRSKGAELGKAIFFAKVIIITGLLPIFAFQKVEGKMFSPLGYTLGFALLGALIITLTLVPVLISMLLSKNVREKHNPFVNAITNSMLNAFSFCWKLRKITVGIAAVIMVIGFMSFHFLGSEFLPDLNEGAIWIRAQLPYSASLTKSKEIGDLMRKRIIDFKEVKYVASQTGRPDDGTDVTGFYNNEFDVVLHPRSEWKSKLSQDALVDSMQRALATTGVDLNFSQPISDNVEEAVSGVKGSICVKVFGDSLGYMEDEMKTVVDQLKTVRGIEDLGLIKNIGQPELDIELDQQHMALYNVSTADAEAVISMAIGGKAVSQLYEGIRKFDIRVRFPEEFRSNVDEIASLLVPTQNGSRVPLKEIASISRQTGPCLIFRDDNQRYAAVKFSVRGRDMGGAIAEAQEKVDNAVKLKRGYSMVWQGDFENQRRATLRLEQVVPISLILVFFLLFGMFGNFKDAGLVFLNVPFAIVGGIFALLITGTHFSISAGIGFIALFGICIQDGVLLITVFKKNLDRVKGRSITLFTALKEGVTSRVRPVMMTALMAAIGLLPAAVSTGIGSESSRPLARVVIGGILCAMLFSLLVFPLIFAWAYRKVDQSGQKHIDEEVK